jgi:hypothetical protein
VQPTYDDKTPFGTGGTDPAYVQYTGTEIRTVTLTVLNGGPWTTRVGWWAGALSGLPNGRPAGLVGLEAAPRSRSTLYVRGGASPGTSALTATSWRATARCSATQPQHGYRATAGEFAHAYSALVGTSYNVSTYLPAYAALTLWTPGYAPTILNSAGVVSPSLAGSNAQLVDVAIIRCRFPAAQRRLSDRGQLV